MRGLTKRQGEIFEYIKRFSIERGYPPALRDFQKAFDIHSTNGVSDHLRALKARGYIEIDPKISRGIRVLSNGRSQGMAEEEKTSRQQVLEALEDGCGKTARELAEQTRMSLPVVRVQLSSLKREGKVSVRGLSALGRGRKVKSYVATSPPTPLHSSNGNGHSAKSSDDGEVVMAPPTSHILSQIQAQLDWHEARSVRLRKAMEVLGSGRVEP